MANEEHYDLVSLLSSGARDYLVRKNGDEVRKINQGKKVINRFIFLLFYFFLNLFGVVGICIRIFEGEGGKSEWEDCGIILCRSIWGGR